MHLKKIYFMSLDSKEIEKKWKEYWKASKTYEVSNESDKPKYYVLDMFPYPSGSGLHVGHPLGYIASDIYSRYKRMKGYNVLHPMGFDAFGLPAEQYAIDTGIHPADSTEKNIQRYKQQLDNIGLSFDWSREFRTSDPKYYKWTQWIFTQLFHHYYDIKENKAISIEELISKFEANGSEGVQAFHTEHPNFTKGQWANFSNVEKNELLMHYRLAYRKKSFVNWCEALGTVLANDEIKDGLSERGGHPVVKKEMTQWFLRITAYAERLLEGLNQVAWSDSLKTIQRNWIGRSEGAEIKFLIPDTHRTITVFTTRPDTIFGATFLVLAPEHKLISELTTAEQAHEVEEYLQYVQSRSERERSSDTKRVTGVFTGSYAIHPFTDERIPIWTAEYVLKDYGSGAIMAVPSRDERDFAFATKFGIPIIEVIDQTDYPEAKREDKVGIMINSPLIDGKKVPDAIAFILEEIERRNIGRRKISYKLRDANFSRQRYWGEPFPVIYDPENIAHTLSDLELPLELPPLNDFKPTKDGRAPLAKLQNWVNLPNGYKRETDTMPGFAGSSWYFLRYMDPWNEAEPFSANSVNYWKDVDLYVGGTEHAVGHLMYSRFWHKFLHDIGKVPTDEPFKKLINQGMIQGVIEHILLKKSLKDGHRHFICAGLAKMQGLTEDELSKFSIDISFVKEYGSKESYLDIEGIKKFLDWRPEFKDAYFECANGIYHRGQFTPKGESEGPHLLTHSEIGKMSKSKHNVINPDHVVEEYGADCFRMYEMFLGPVEQSKPWDIQGIDGVYKFLKRYWGLFLNRDNQWLVTGERATLEELKILHRTIQKVTSDIERFSFNTAVSSFMMAVGELRKLHCHKYEILEPLNRLISPFAPFISEELQERLGGVGSVHHTSYPEFDPSAIEESTVQYPICINGKKRGLAEFPADADKETLAMLAKDLEVVQTWTENKEIMKTIVVPKRMINFVVK